MDEGTFNLFDFSSSLNPLKKSVGGKSPSVNERIPINPTPSIGTYSPSVIRKKNVPTAKVYPDMGKLSSAQVTKLKESGISNDTILKFAFPEKDSVTDKNPIEKGFVDKIKEDVNKRGENLGKTIESDSSVLTKVGAAFGEGAMLGGDILGSAISSATPDEVKEGLKEGGKWVMDKTPQVVKDYALSAFEKGGEVWAKFEKEYPETARNVTSAAQIASIVPIGKGVKATGEIAKEGVEATVEGVGKIPSAVAKGVDGTREFYESSTQAIANKATEKLGPVVKRKSIAEGKGIFKDGKFVGTEEGKDIALRRLGGVEGTAYNAKLAEKAVADITPEEISLVRKSTEPAKKLAEISGKKVEDLAGVQKELARTNAKRFTEDDLTISSIDGTVTENPVRMGLAKLATSKGISVDEKASIQNWVNKLDTEGSLSAEDVSDIAILMGRRQNDFTQLINGVKAKDVEFERLRKDVKEVYRNSAPPQARALDEVLHAQLDFKSFLDEMGEDVRKYNAALDTSVGSKLGRFIANTPFGKAGVGLLKAVFRTDFGTGKAGDVFLQAKDYADELAKNMEKVKRLSNEVGSAKTKEDAIKIIEKAEKEMRDEMMKSKLKPKYPELPAPSGKPASAKEVDLRNIQVPSKGFNSPEITPSSKIVVPTTSAKLKPYKEPNYKTPLPRKKNIPKPKK